ncbi:MAG: CAP domain-containing protein [Chitinivibrionales bacterium]|nr:CAP domain-containing protein [Chitinivibrionales bacterium]
MRPLVGKAGTMHVLSRLLGVAAVCTLAGTWTACDDDDAVPTLASDAPYGGIEMRVHALVNAHRAGLGLAQLQWSGIIAEQCRSHSENMADGTTPFGHSGFSDRGAAIDPYIPHTASAENVARVSATVTDPAQSAVTIWLGSSGHRGNIEGNYDMTGVGVARSADGRYYFTQFFLRAD